MTLDRCVFFLTNAYVYARNFRVLRNTRKEAGTWPNVARPREYIDRILWRKLIDHSEQVVTFCDKLAAKRYVQERCPDLPVAEILWVGEDARDIPEHLLSGEREVYVKCNHGCEFNLRVGRDHRVDRSSIEARVSAWMKNDYGKRWGQWGYRAVPRRIFVEEAVGDVEQGLLDISIRASDGTPILGSMNGHNKTPSEWTAYLDLDGNVIDGRGVNPVALVGRAPTDVDYRGLYLDAMRHTRVLSRGVDYARFDFMISGGRLYGGEITLYPNAGRSPIEDPDLHYAIVSAWDLRNSGFMKSNHRGWWGVYARALRRSIERGDLDGHYLKPQSTTDRGARAAPDQELAYASVRG